MRQLCDAELDLHVAALRDLMGVVQRLPGIRKQGAHLHLALDEELPARIPHPVLIRELLACLNAQQNIVRLRVLGVRIVNIVGGDQRDPQALAHGHERHVHLLLVLIAVVLKLEEETSLSEDIQVFQRGFIRRRNIIPDYIPCDFSGQTCAGSDNTLVELPQQFYVNPRLIVIPLREGTADYFHQVGVALVVLRQKDQMVIAVISRPLFPVKPRTGRHINLASDDRLDACLFCRLIKIDHAVHDAVIGYGRAVHSKLFDALYIFFNLIGAVQE